MQVVYGPGTFINAAVGELQAQLSAAHARGRGGRRGGRGSPRAALARREGRSPAEQARLARAAAQLAYAQFVRDLLQLGATYGLGVTQAPRLDEPDFVSTLVFDPARGAAHAEGALRVPVPDAALRADPGAAAAGAVGRPARARAVGAGPRGGGDAAVHLHDAGGYTVTGVPVLAEDLADALAGATLRLLVRRRGGDGARAGAAVPARGCGCCRSLVALAAVAIIVRGDARWPARRLTMASIAVLPVLLGLAVDYAIQFQARVQEERSAGGRGAARRRPARSHGRARHRGRLPRPAAVAGADGARVRGLLVVGVGRGARRSR